MATRLYFPVTDAAAVSPDFQSGWNGVTGQGVRRLLQDTKGADAITAGTTISLASAAGSVALDRQYVSDPIDSGVNFGGMAVTMQLMTRELAATDNVDRLMTAMKAVSRDGTVTQFTLFTVSNNGGTAEFIANASHRNKSGFTGQIIAGNPTTSQGDRLVVEVGYSNSTNGTTPNASAKYGQNATDLPINETATANGAGWIEFSGTIAFEAGAARRLFVVS